MTLCASWNYEAISIAWMHSRTVAFRDIAAIRASWTSLLFLTREAANKTFKRKRKKKAVNNIWISSILDEGEATRGARFLETYSPSGQVLLLFFAQLWLTPVYESLWPWFHDHLINNKDAYKHTSHIGSLIYVNPHYAVKTCSLVLENFGFVWLCHI